LPSVLWIKVTTLSFYVVSPILIPIVTEFRCSELDHGLSPVYGPSPPRAFHPILDQVPTSAFGSPAANGESQGEILIVAQESLVFEDVVSRGGHGLAFLPAELIAVCKCLQPEPK
jgi:hypothetical protein